MHARFDANTEHNVAEFLQRLLDGMAAAEAKAGRVLRDPYGGAVENAPMITHLERLFSFLEERRLRCPVCHKVTQSFQRKVVLDLPLADEDAKGVTVGDLLLRYCAKTELVQTCDGCRSKRDHVSQRRVVGDPNVLIVRPVRDSLGTESLRRAAVRPELRLEMPGVGRVDLWAVVYHQGATFSRGHYHAVCRGADGEFYSFDDRTKVHSGCTRSSEDAVERLLLTRVCLMVYVRAGGAATFEDMAEAPGPLKKSPEKKMPVTVSGTAASASALKTPPRATAGKGVPPAPPTASCETTPSCAPPRKRICVECKGEFEDPWENMSLATGSAHSTPLRSPPTKCLKCTPGRTIFGGPTYVPELPTVPAWPTDSAVQALSSSKSAGRGQG